MKPKHYTHLSFSERRQIYVLLGRKVPLSQIATILGRHHSTIYREVQRNTYWDDDPFMSGYFHMNAQELYRRRRQSLQVFLRKTDLKSYVIEKLKVYWSPEQIAGYLKRMGVQGFYACSETIYRLIYSDEGKGLGLYRYLFKGRKNRRKKFGRKPRGTRIPEHHGIAFRPEIVTDRKTFGHWEGDLMIFNREHGPTKLTSLIERKSRYTILAKNSNRRPIPVIGQIGNLLSKLPSHARETITFDRGFEFLKYPILHEKIGMKSYFCDPQAPWQKGGVESNNNRIRRFLPRETKLDELGDSDIYGISVIMNNTPRKCLGFKTPQEVLNAHLQQSA